MKIINRESLLKREAWLAKHLRSVRKWTQSPEKSDFQLLKRQEQFLYTLIMIFIFNLMRTGFTSIFEAEEILDFGLIVDVMTIGFICYLFYSLIRLRWALSAFEQYAPQMLNELNKKIIEQLGAGDAEEAV